jgi:hypothetical protein
MHCGTHDASCFFLAQNYRHIKDKVMTGKNITWKISNIFPSILLSYHEHFIPMKLVKLIKLCLNKTYNEVCKGKYLSDSFTIQNGLKQRDALSTLLAIRKDCK